MHEYARVEHPHVADRHWPPPQPGMLHRRDQPRCFQPRAMKDGGVLPGTIDIACQCCTVWTRLAFMLTMRFLHDTSLKPDASNC